MLPVSDFRTVNKNQLYRGTFAANGVLSLSSDGSFGKVKIRLLIVSSLALSVLFATQLVFAANLSTDGQKLTKVEESKERYESENADLKAQIARESSLTNLSQKSGQLGFTASPKIITP